MEREEEREIGTDWTEGVNEAGTEAIEATGISIPAGLQEGTVEPAGGYYQRQETLSINKSQNIAVIGVGGVGSWVAMYLALAGVEDITLFDGDNVSVSNLNRFPLGPEAIGMNKAEAMAEFLTKLRPEIRITPRLNFDPDRHKSHDGVGDRNWDWIVCSTDSLKSRQIAYDFARGAGIQYIECGAEGHGMTVTFEPAMFSTPMEEEEGYRSVPVFVGPCVMAASLAVYHILIGRGAAQVTYKADWGTAVKTPWRRVPGVSILTVDEGKDHPKELCDHCSARYRGQEGHKVIATLRYTDGGDEALFSICSTCLRGLMADGRPSRLLDLTPLPGYEDQVAEITGVRKVEVDEVDINAILPGLEVDGE